MRPVARPRVMNWERIVFPIVPNLDLPTRFPVREWDALGDANVVPCSSIYVDYAPISVLIIGKGYSKLTPSHACVFALGAYDINARLRALYFEAASTIE